MKAQRTTSQAEQQPPAGAGQPNQREALRALPPVNELLRLLAEGDAPVAAEPATRAVRAALTEARATIQAGGTGPTRPALLERVRALLLAASAPNLRPVINATGVIVNTNLGRAPLSEAAIAQVAAVARGYSNLEYDLATGGRGSRQVHTRALLRELTGAEDALIVNNNAAAVLVVLTALAAGREVVISRGELVEIGGGFRIPDVLRQSGARLVEVGTTNRTRLRDYAAAITPETALLLSVHPSNFRVIGFTETAPLGELAALAHSRGLVVVHDVGSGALIPTERWGLAHEPTPQESIAAGADVVCFSGDKLLGGPQAGIIVGRTALLAEIERHPLMRALRIDKLTLAALEVTLRQHRDGEAERAIPVWRAAAAPLEALETRATGWAATLRQRGLPAEVWRGESAVGGGSLPGETLPTWLCAIPCEGQTGMAAPPPDAAGQRADAAERLAERLRTGEPPVVARVLRGHLLLDPRTVLPDQDDALLAALYRAWMPA